MRTAAIVFLSALFLASCTSDTAQTVPDLNYTNVPPISLNVAKIEVRDDYVPPMRPPNVDHLFRQPPDVTVRDLLDHALIPSGGPKTLRVIIEDASVIDRKLPDGGGVLDAITPRPSDRYDAHMALRFELFDPAAPDIITGHASVIAQRSTTLMNNFSPADRDRAAFNLTESLMRDVQDGLRTTVRNTFGVR
jgi:hypothetical protein